MVFSQKSRLVMAHWAIIALVVIFLTGTVSNFIARYLGFLTALGGFGSFIIKFMATFFLIMVTDWISEKILKI